MAKRAGDSPISRSTTARPENKDEWFAHVPMSEDDTIASIVEIPGKTVTRGERAKSSSKPKPRAMQPRLVASCDVTRVKSRQDYCATQGQVKMLRHNSACARVSDRTSCARLSTINDDFGFSPCHHAAMAPSRSPNRAGARWTMRIVPLCMICIFGVATYAVVVRLCGEPLSLLRPDERILATAHT